MQQVWAMPGQENSETEELSVCITYEPGVRIWSSQDPEIEELLVGHHLWVRRVGTG